MTAVDPLGAAAVEPLGAARSRWEPPEATKSRYIHIVVIYPNLYIYIYIYTYIHIVVIYPNLYYTVTLDHDPRWVWISWLDCG